MQLIVDDIRRLQLRAVVCALMLAVNGVVCAASQEDYDYRALAIQSILTSAQEAQKLSNIEERISLVITAANVLPPSHRLEAVGLLDRSLQDIKDLNSTGKEAPVGRAVAQRLYNELLAAYARLDPERALALQNTDRNEQTSRDDRESLRFGGKWSAEILARRARADQAAGLALSIIDAEPERAFSLVVQSVRDGIVSNSISAIFDKLTQKQDRRFLDQLQMAVAQSLSTTHTLDFFSLGYAAALLDDDRMPAVAKRRIARYLMNSVETWVALVKGDDGNGGLDPSYVSSSFTRLILSVRPAIAKHFPADILEFDILLGQASRFVPEKTRSNLQVFQPETLTDSREKLNAILREPGAERRDLRLIGLASELLRKLDATDDLESGLDLLTDTISQFSDTRLRTTYEDLLLIKRLNSLVRVKQFDSARKLVASISSAETRVWTMLALAVAAKKDKVLAFELTVDAIKALDAVSTSPAKVGLALMAAALLAEDTPSRSFELLSSAVKYSNSSKDSSEATDVASAIGLTASIGNLSLTLAREPGSLADVRIDPRLGSLGKTDWFRSQEVANSFTDQTLRLRLKLQFAAGVLASRVR